MGALPCSTIRQPVGWKPGFITYKRIRMLHCSKVVIGRRGRSRALGGSLLIGLLSVLLLGCGITLSAGHTQTELFKKLTIEGDFVTGGQLQMVLDYAQPYAASIDVQCDLLTGAPAAPPKPAAGASGRKGTPTLVHIPAPVPTPGNRLSVVLVTSFGPNPNGSTVGKSTPVPGSISRKFKAPDGPGRYRLRCYTSADDNNRISETFSIQAGGATPTN